MYKLMMSKVPFDTSNSFNAASVVGKGDYGKIPKKSEGGIYSDEFVDIIHSMMDLVFFCTYIIYFIFLFSETRKTAKYSKNIKNDNI
jgi:hypothetical protein